MMGRKWVKEAQSSDKTLKVWDGMYHEIMNEDGGDEVINFVVKWFVDHLNKDV